LSLLMRKIFSDIHSKVLRGILKGMKNVIVTVILLQ